MWGPGDLQLVLMLLKMYHDWWETGTTTQQRAIQITMDSLGLSTKGRRDLRWLLPGEAPSAPVLQIEDAPSKVRRIRAVDPATDPGVS